MYIYIYIYICIYTHAHHNMLQCWERPTILGLSTPRTRKLNGLLPWAMPQVGDDNPLYPRVRNCMEILTEITHTHQRKNTQLEDSVNKHEIGVNFYTPLY